jgi:hypothetical protein
MEDETEESAERRHSSMPRYYCGDHSDRRVDFRGGEEGRRRGSGFSAEARARARLLSRSSGSRCGDDSRERIKSVEPRNKHELCRWRGSRERGHDSSRIGFPNRTNTLSGIRRIDVTPMHSVRARSHQRRVWRGEGEAHRWGGGAGAGGWERKSLRIAIPWPDIN